jgi:hypothetical protein
MLICFETVDNPNQWGLEANEDSALCMNVRRLFSLSNVIASAAGDPC